MQSAIYEGFVRHRRFEPVRHEFRASIFMMYLDLDELAAAFARRWFWSVERLNLATFRRRDHVGDPSVPLAETIRNLVEAATSERPSGAIRLLTHLRYFGYCFNPLSIYFCFDAANERGNSNERLHCIVAEVTNTPWGERHCYVLRVGSQFNSTGRIGLVEEPMRVRGVGVSDDGAKQSFQFAKEFHVSPFMGMDVEYFWQLTGPAENLILHTENRRNGQSFFDATLVMRRRTITTWSLAHMLLQYPLMTTQVIANIHWQAFLLWFKKVPYVPHPNTCRTGDTVKNTDAAIKDRTTVTK